MGLPYPAIAVLARADEVRLGDICSRLCPNARATKTYDRLLTAMRLAAADREGKKAAKLPLSLNHRQQTGKYPLRYLCTLRPAWSIIERAMNEG
jgi:hypothetical protein